MIKKENLIVIYILALVFFKYFTNENISLYVKFKNDILLMKCKGFIRLNFLLHITIIVQLQISTMLADVCLK